MLRKEGIGTIGQNAVGIYFRLVKEPDAQRKQAAFEETIGKRQLGETDPRGYEYRQRDFAAITGGPWVYGITSTLRGLFVQLPKFADIAKPRQGLATSDNTRFLRYWWG